MNTNTPSQRTCPACHDSTNAADANFCDKCGARLLPHQNSINYQVVATNAETVASESSSVKFFLSKLTNTSIPFLEPQHFRTLTKLLRAPGKSLIDHTSCGEKASKAISYFILFMVFDLFLNGKILKYLGFNNQLLSNLPEVIAPFVLIALMLGIWFIGYITLGCKFHVSKLWVDKKNRTQPKDYYSLLDVFIISLYIYGTNFFLAPTILFLFYPFKNMADGALVHLLKTKAGDPNVSNIENMLTDIPLALFMLYMLFMLIKKTPNYKYIFPRYLAFCVLAISYYVFMYDRVSDLDKYINDLSFLKSNP